MNGLVFFWFAASEGALGSRIRTPYIHLGHFYTHLICELLFLLRRGFVLDRENCLEPVGLLLSEARLILTNVQHRLIPGLVQLSSIVWCWVRWLVRHGGLLVVWREQALLLVVKVVMVQVIHNWRPGRTANVHR